MLPAVLSLGPLAIPTGRAAALLLIMLFLWSADRLATRHGRPAFTGLLALGAGLLAARIAHVAAMPDAYAAEPLTALMLWQGGLNAPAGAAAAALVLGLGLRGTPGLAPALLLLPAALAALWVLILEPALKPEPRPLQLPPGLVALDGQTMAPAGKPMAINLWATWCPPCRRELPMLASEAETAPVPLLLVNQGEPADTVRRHLKAAGLAEAGHLLDPGGRLGAAIGQKAFPTTLFVSADGMILDEVAGEISRARLREGMKLLEAARQTDR